MSDSMLTPLRSLIKNLRDEHLKMPRFRSHVLTITDFGDNGAMSGHFVILSTKRMLEVGYPL